MIGKVPDGWRVKKLGDVSTLIGGGTPSRNNNEYWENGNIVWLSPTDLDKIGKITEINNSKDKITELGLAKSSAKLLPIGTVLYSSRATIGKIAISTVELSTNQGFTNFICNESLLNKYLAVCLNRYREEITLLSNSTTFKEVSKSSFKDFKIPLPPLPQQEKIVKVLDISSALIEKQKELIQKYDLFLKSKFIEMFGDIKNNPYGFDIKPLSKFGKIITGNTPPRIELENYDNDFIEWIKTDNISPNKLYISTAKEYLSELGMSKSRTLEKGGLLITCIAGSLKSIGNVAMTDRKITFNQQINAIQPSKDVNSLYLYWLIKLNKNYIHTFATSSMKKMISKGVFQDIPFIKAPYDLQSKFSIIASKIDTIKEQETKKLQHLETLHKSLMDKAFKGEIQ